MRKNILWLLLSLLLVFVLILSGCGGSEPAAPEEPAAEEPAAELTGSVGVVLPTREEPRWIQDETRFRDTLEEAGYEVEILFSQGDSAVELANVERGGNRRMFRLHVLGPAVSAICSTTLRFVVFLRAISWRGLPAAAYHASLAAAGSPSHVGCGQRLRRLTRSRRRRRASLVRYTSRTPAPPATG